MLLGTPHRSEVPQQLLLGTPHTNCGGMKTSDEGWYPAHRICARNLGHLRFDLSPDAYQTLDRLCPELESVLYLVSKAYLTFISCMETRKMTIMDVF